MTGLMWYDATKPPAAAIADACVRHVQRFGYAPTVAWVSIGCDVEADGLRVEQKQCVLGHNYFVGVEE